MPPAPHIAVLGAGPAGSTAAAHLARAGLRVTLLESRPFPRVKVCGEYISPAATSILESLIPPHELAAAGARRITRMVLEAGDHRSTWTQPTPAWSLSRAALDTLLLRKATEAGAQVLQPATARRVTFADDCVTIELTDARTITCDIVIHADGSGRHDPAGPVPNAPALLAHKCHLRIPPGTHAEDPDTITMRSCSGAYIGTIGVEHGLATCALVARRELSRTHPSTDAIVQHLWPAFRPEWRTTPWKSCGVPRSRPIMPGHPRSFRLGNAAGAVDPVGGEGIGLALWSGAELAHHTATLARLATLTTRDQLNSLHTTQHQLHRSYTAQLRLRLPACQLTAWTLMRPHLVRALWPFALVPGLSFRPFYRLTGKAAPASP
ncbi:MAG TPA: FAD-dependent oxidoreductase [Phycisphaerales bacterium]|nr:FAD-dependent oxidoreductase [Phycisphaerales bacterium]